MQRDKAYIFDILEAAKLAITYVGEKTKEEFLNDLPPLISALESILPPERAP